MVNRNFPSFIDAFLDYNKNLGVSQKFLFWSCISGIAGALERKTWIVYNGTQVIYPNLFIMLIADSGIANKSTASRPIMELLYEIDGLHFMSTQMSGASLVKQLGEAGNKKQFLWEGQTFKNSSLFSYSSEAKTTLGDSKGLTGIQELLTDFYDCGDPNIWSNKKGWNKETLSGGSITVWNPCLNLLYCSTPTWLIEALGKSGIAGGFASRVLFINEKDRFRGNLSWIDEEDDKPEANLEIRTKLIEDLTQISKLQGPFKAAKGFKEIYNRILDKRNAKIDEDPKSQMAPYYARKMWHCLKLSQIMAAQSSNSMIVLPEHLEAANAALESLEADMYEPFNNDGENKNLQSFKLFWEIIRKKESWTMQTIVARTIKHASSTQRSEHLQNLLQMKRLQMIPIQNGGFAYQVIDNSPLP